MDRSVSKTILIMIAVSDMILVSFIVYFVYSNSRLNNEIEQLRSEKIKMLEDHGECLKYKEIALKKELIEKYMESMISLRNKIEQGYVPVKEDIGSFIDRSEYIVDNLEIYEPSKEKISQYLLFIGSMKTLLEPFIGKTQDAKGGKLKKN